MEMAGKLWVRTYEFQKDKTMARKTLTKQLGEAKTKLSDYCRELKDCANERDTLANKLADVRAENEKLIRQVDLSKSYVSSIEFDLAEQRGRSRGYADGATSMLRLIADKIVEGIQAANPPTPEK